MTAPQLTLTARVNPSAADARRGIIRVHPEVLAALSLREWDAVSIVGARRTAAVVAQAPDIATGTVLLDDITFSNAGVREDAGVVLAPVSVHGGNRVVVSGSALASRSVDQTTLRRALLGKVLSVGDAVSLLPRDLGPELTASTAVRALARSVGITWTNELVTVSAVDPSGPVSVQTNTAVLWDGDGVAADTATGSGVTTGPLRAASSAEAAAGAGNPSPTATGGLTRGWQLVEPRTGVSTDTDTEAEAEAEAEADTSGHEGAGQGGQVRPVSELVGVDTQVARLTEWVAITLDEPQVLRALGAAPRLGVIVSGPPGVGKATMVRSVCAGRPLAVVDGPSVGALEASSRLSAVASAIAALRGRHGSGVLLIADVDALLPAAAEPVSTLILDELRTAIGDGSVVLVCTTAEPAGADSRLRDPELCDRELVIGLPDAALRARLLSAILSGVPTEPGLDLTPIAARTPGFVAADLAALAREAAIRAAGRVTASRRDPAGTDEVTGDEPGSPGSGARKLAAQPAVAAQPVAAGTDDGERPVLRLADLQGALEVIRPVSRGDSPDIALGSITLDDVGDMVETKQALTETVLWPLQHPDTFTRLGVEPPRGVLLFGPPGCGKTFVVRALAASGRLSVHTVKGAELMDKWVGASEKAVRDLFARARESAPSLIFLDEVDALAPRRGQTTDSGVTDRVVASLLTELDGVEPLSDVVVLGATNRPDLIDPALLRPGRLERLVFVPPPDADARGDILRASGRNVPLADDIVIDELAADLDGYSAADCSARLREAALSAMRRDIDAATVTADDIAVARERVRPSLDAAQVENLRAYAERRVQ